MKRGQWIIIGVVVLLLVYLMFAVVMQVQTTAVWLFGHS